MQCPLERQSTEIERRQQCNGFTVNTTEAAMILIFSKYHHNFRNQRPENVLKCLESLSLEGMKCTNPNLSFKPKKGHCDGMTPLEAAKVSIFSQNHYDFRNQCPGKILKRLNLHSLEAMKCNDPNP